MKIRIKKFKLRYEGYTFGEGAEIDIPEAEAKKLVAANPEQFEYVPDTPEEAVEKAKASLRITKPVRKALTWTA